MYAPLAVAKTGMEAQRTRLQAITNNIANASTHGFKPSRAVFENLLYQVVRQPGGTSGASTTLPTGMQLGTGVRVVGTQTIHNQGSLQQTNNPLDIAIQGEGFFRVQQDDGTTAYTRAGKFNVNSSGQLVTPEGKQILPAITVPTDAVKITIAATGEVSSLAAGSTTETTLGTLQLAKFINPAGLMHLGGNLFQETVSSGTPTTANPGSSGAGSLVQGQLEASAVNVVEEIVNMIEAQRAYEFNSKSVKSGDDMLRMTAQVA